MLQGGRAWLYSPEGETWALGSNQLEERCRCNPMRRWRKLLEAYRQGPQWQAGRHLGGASRPHLVASRDPEWCGVFLCHLEPSGVVFIAVKFGFILCFYPPCRFSRITLLKIQIHQNSWKLSVWTPKFLLVILFKHFFMLNNWWFMMNDNYRQQRCILRDSRSCWYGERADELLQHWVDPCGWPRALAQLQH
jgi:hypothetical protein